MVNITEAVKKPQGFKNTRPNASKAKCWLGNADNTEEEKTLKQSTNSIYYIKT